MTKRGHRRGGPGVPRDAARSPGIPKLTRVRSPAPALLMVRVRFLTLGLPVECSPEIPCGGNLLDGTDGMLAAHELAKLCEQLGLWRWRWTEHRRRRARDFGLPVRTRHADSLLSDLPARSPDGYWHAADTNSASLPPHRSGLARSRWRLVVVFTGRELSRLPNPARAAAVASHDPQGRHERLLAGVLTEERG